MNRRQHQTLEQAAATLEIMGYTKECKALKRVIDTEILASPQYEAAWTLADCRLDVRKAFAYWYAQSGRNDLDQAHDEYFARIGTNV